MIEIYPAFKGTDITTSFEVMVIGMHAVAGDIEAICVDEDGVLHTAPLHHIRVDWHYDRKVGQWVSVNDQPGPDDE